MMKGKLWLKRWWRRLRYPKRKRIVVESNGLKQIIADCPGYIKSIAITEMRGFDQPNGIVLTSEPELSEGDDIVIWLE
jgi:hypothetical protein